MKPKIRKIQKHLYYNRLFKKCRITNNICIKEVKTYKSLVQNRKDTISGVHHGDH